MATEPTFRQITPTFDKRGEPVWRSVMSPPDNSIAQIKVIPMRVIPVIFVPGVMGSNLIQKGVPTSKAVKWRLDSKGTAGSWALANTTAAYRKLFLNPVSMRVDRDGKVPDDMPLPAEELRRRGWGEVGAISYLDALVWLETNLNDFENAKNGERAKLLKDILGAELGDEVLSEREVRLSYRYRFPVYACGYNWLDDNATSAARLGSRIDEAIARYLRDGMMCEKVVIVTHSMGGLVARYCSEVSGSWVLDNTQQAVRAKEPKPYRDKIFGIVHGVMPAIGAAAVYRRMKAGTEDPTAWFNVAGTLTASALGNDAGEMTAVLSSAPGPLQLLPTPEYGNGWLKINDGTRDVTLPQSGDPYREIYTVRSKWWGLCDERLMNPLNTGGTERQRQVQAEADWVAFGDVIDQQVKRFHTSISQKYHRVTHTFCGDSAAHLAYGDVHWRPTLALHKSYQQVTLNPLNAEDGGLIEKGESRNLSVPISGHISKEGLVDPQTLLPVRGDSPRINQTFQISRPEEQGDGTVPRRSGLAPRAVSKAFLRVNTDHEPAFKPNSPDGVRALRFTLKAVVRIAMQGVSFSSLMYKDFK